jgi:hypothetical protein
MRIRLLSPATIIACIALLVALGGTAMAGVLITGSQIKDNTVSTLDITNGTVRSIDVKNNAITSLDILNGTLKAVDFAPGQLPVGPAGAAGPQGSPGAQGAPGLAAVEIVTVDSANSSTGVKQADATCPAGKKVIGGGAHLYGAGGDIALDESYPSSVSTWRATAWEVNATALSWHVSAFAICATVAA